MIRYHDQANCKRRHLIIGSLYQRVKVHDSHGSGQAGRYGTGAVAVSSHIKETSA